MTPIYILAIFISLYAAFSLATDVKYHAPAFVKLKHLFLSAICLIFYFLALFVFSPKITLQIDFKPIQIIFTVLGVLIFLYSFVSYQTDSENLAPLSAYRKHLFLFICTFIFLIVATIEFAKPTIFENGQQKGEEIGYENGYDEGYDEGFDDGYSSGHRDGYDEGYNDGGADGYDEGYRIGYYEGLSDALERYSLTLGDAPSDPDEETVFISDNGSKFHRANCSYLKSVKFHCSRSQAISSGYSPCSRCNP